ncbi:MAG: translocase [Labilithrix sp.]|nr:translocase [Labilithrix sp.]
MLTFVDIRTGEARLVAQTFGVLLLIVTAHTMLDTARDALLLSKISSDSLSVAYIALAAATLPATAAAGLLCARVGPLRALLLAVLAGAGTMTALYFVPPSRASAFATYVVTGLIGATLVPLFWMWLGRLLTVAQGKRLVGPVSAAAVAGGLVGSSIAAALVGVVPVHALLLVAGGTLLAAATLVGLGPSREEHEQVAPPRGRKSDSTRPSVDPFVRRIAGIVILATATALVVDYFFMWTVSRTIPKENLGTFFSRYYLAINGISLVLQFALGAAIVRRLGIAPAGAITPALIGLAAIASLLTGGAPLAVLVAKGLDGGLRYSLHRSTTELFYLPIRPEARERAKPLIDGALVKITQAAAAGALGILGLSGALSPWVFGVLATLLALTWLFATLAIRRPYLELLRRGLGPRNAGTIAPAELDLASAEVLVGALGSSDPQNVITAMNALARRGRQGLIPALVLHHRDPRVLDVALAIFGDSPRSDWRELARGLLLDESELVSLAAARALARHGDLEALVRLESAKSPRLAGYASARLALSNLSDDPPRGTVLRRWQGEDVPEARLGSLMALADAPRSARARALLEDIAGELGEEHPKDVTPLLARAAAAQCAQHLAPLLVSLLRERTTYDTTERALVELREVGFETIRASLADTSEDPRLRIHLPHAIAAFGTQRAADLLVQSLEDEPSGVVRYKSLRALGYLVAARNVRVPRHRIRKLAERNITEALRVLALRAALDAPSPSTTPAALRLLVGLLEDKRRQAVERTFRLLKIAHPREDFRRIHLATLSGDARARANAAELVDAILTRHDEHDLREKVRLITDDLPVAERVARAAPYLPSPAPRSYEEALRALVEDSDVMLASIALHHAAEVGDVELADAAARARTARPALEIDARRLFGGEMALQGAHV